MSSFRSPDGTSWSVKVESPSHSSAILVFVHPSATARYNRYAWINARGAGVSDPRARLEPATVLAGLSEQQLASLFRRSMPIHANRPAYLVS
ncbi:MAG: hypothetical protein ABIZ91_19575 [Gemmatimonadaceae bacterium]